MDNYVDRHRAQEKFISRAKTWLYVMPKKEKRGGRRIHSGRKAETKAERKKRFRNTSLMLKKRRLQRKV